MLEYMDKRTQRAYKKAIELDSRFDDSCFESEFREWFKSLNIQEDERILIDFDGQRVIYNITRFNPLVVNVYDFKVV
jgi:hypothetical protein